MPDHDNTLQCPKCGYTARDAAIHMDHGLCDGEIPEARSPVMPGTNSDAIERLRSYRDTLRCVMRDELGQSYNLDLVEMRLTVATLGDEIARKGIDNCALKMRRVLCRALDRLAEIEQEQDA